MKKIFLCIGRFLSLVVVGCGPSSQDSFVGQKPQEEKPAVIGLTELETREILHSSDGKLSVWNYNSGQGGTMPDIVSTLRWYDGYKRIDWVLDAETGSLGWVESIATLKTSAETVYVIVSEMKVSSTSFVTELTAFTIKEGEQVLQDVPGFFPTISGADENRTAVRWEYRRNRGDNFPRPFEVRVDEDRQSLRVWIFPEAHGAPRYSLDDITRQEFVLMIDKGRLVSSGFDAADRMAIEAMTGY